MKSNKEIIIINAIPNSEIKIKMLEEQIFYFKKLGLPIMIVSGCEVPVNLLNQIEYCIVNTDNEVIEKDYSYKMYSMGLHNLSYDYTVLNDCSCHFYWKNVNSTITKNIKLAFNAANILGYTHAIYTEDDNIFKDGSFDYLNENRNAIKNGQYKMAGWLGDLAHDLPMMCTAFFFADIQWFISNFTLPDKKDEWYDYNTTVKYQLHRPYEYVYYKFFEDKLNLFYDSVESYRKLVSNNTNNTLMDFGKSNRRFSEKNLIDTFFTVLPVDNDPHKSKKLVLVNTSFHLPTGKKDYTIDIFMDNIFYKQLFLPKNGWYMETIASSIESIKLSILNYGDKVISCDMNDINNNGHIIIQR